MTPKRIAGAALLAGMLLAAGCSWIAFAPPFDVTGAYRGVWEGTLNGDDRPRTCGMSLSLEHDGDYDLLQGFVFRGTATVYFTCSSLFDDVADAGLPARISTDVTGYVTRSGRVTLVSAETDSDTSLAVSITGRGEDADGNGDMDALSGSWSLVVRVPDHDQFSLNGTVEAGRN